MRRNHQSVVRALRQNSSVIERFWANVNRSDRANVCWEWSGRVKPGNRPSFSFDRFTIAAPRIAWFLETGDLPLGGRMHQLCNNPLCVRPSHLGWRIGRRTESVLEAMNDGYVRVAGASVSQGEATPGIRRILRSSSESEAA
jgi:hypothetical protein